MKALFTCATALIFGLTANSLALAGGPGGKSGSGNSGNHSSQNSHGSSSSHSSTRSYTPSHGSHTHSNSYSSYKSTNTHSNSYSSYKSTKYNYYHLTHGKTFSQGFYYPGKYHGHWQYCCYSKSFGCHVYCCPWTHCWYYWCAPDYCYYPVYYVPYSCYCWGTSVAYCSAPIPPVGVSLPEPADVIGPTE